MYSFLDSYWEMNNFEDLSILLGIMDPNLWGDGIPIDKSLVTDWEEITLKNNSISEVEGFTYLISFLEKQLDWLKLDMLVYELKSSLNLKEDNWKMWLQIFKENV
jgi:hypothetical protein